MIVPLNGAESIPIGIPMYPLKIKLPTVKKHSLMRVSLVKIFFHLPLEVYHVRCFRNTNAFFDFRFQDE